jgi:hypothetical protein
LRINTDAVDRIPGTPDCTSLVIPEAIMSLLVIAAFLFVPMLLLLGAQYSAARLLNANVSRKPYFTGLVLGFISLLLGVNFMIDRWGDESKPEYYKPVWDALLSPSIFGLAGALGLAYLLRLTFSRKAFTGGWISGLASAAGSVGLFYWYFTG